MYQIFGIPKCLTAFAILAAIIGLAIWKISPPDTPLEAWGIATKSVSLASMLTLLLGQTCVFPYLCRYVIKPFLPDIDGEWDAELQSNWSQIEARINGGESEQATAPVHAKITIIARLFHINVILDTKNLYSDSTTKIAKITKDKETGRISLNYIYLNNTPDPHSTDSSSHLGAACLELDKQGKSLRGVYWTNRNWKKGLNTAGTITLKRKQT